MNQETVIIELNINSVKYFSRIIDMPLTNDPERELIQACKKALDD